MQCYVHNELPQFPSTVEWCIRFISYSRSIAQLNIYSTHCVLRRACMTGAKITPNQADQTVNKVITFDENVPILKRKCFAWLISLYVYIAYQLKTEHM